MNTRVVVPRKGLQMYTKDPKAANFIQIEAETQMLIISQ